MSETLKKCKAKGGKLIKGICIVDKGKKDIGSKEGTLSHPVAFFISLLVFTLILIIPGMGAIAALIGMVISLFIMRKRMKPRQSGDLLKTVGILLLFILIWLFLGWFSLFTVSWIRLIIAALIADGISFIFGFFEVTTAPTIILPFILSIIEGFVVFILVMLIVTGINGVILGVIAGLIAFFIPIPFPLLITVSFIILKLIATLIGSIFGGVI